MNYKNLPQKIICEGLKNPEGPISLPDGSWLVTEMDIGAITHISENRDKKTIATTGLPNGLAVDKHGDIWVADAKWCALVKVKLNGSIEIITKGNKQDPFLLPNDLCFGPDGMIYMTDSGITLDELRKVDDPIDAYDLLYDGKVFKINPVTGDCITVDKGLRLTNGIAFGPNGKNFFVAETLTGNIYKYSLNQWRRSLFGQVMIKKPKYFGKIAGPDGMAFDEKGNLYVAVVVQGDITVLTQEGDINYRIMIDGTLPTNVAFDVNGSKELFITEASIGRLISIETNNEGLPLYK